MSDRIKPCSDPCPTSDAAENTPDATPQRRILLAEDSPVNQMLAACILEKHGYTVVRAATGREALAAVAAQVFALLLLDLEMPDMNGFEVTAAIRAHERTTGAHLPIVAFTGHTMPGVYERCLAAGMDAYVAKPFRVHELLDVIASQLQPPPAE